LGRTGDLRAQEEAQKARPSLSPLSTSLNGGEIPDPWAEEDKERSAIDSEPLQLGGSHGAYSQPSSLIGSGYTTVFPNAPFVFWGDETVGAKSKYGDLWEELDFREVISQLRDMRSPGNQSPLG